VDWKDQVIADQNKLIIELREYIAKLERRIEELEKRNAALEQRNSELERRLGLNSSNSFQLPSSDGLQKPVRVQSLREKSNKKSGGQAGHQGQTLKQFSNPDKVVMHESVACSRCQTSLTNTLTSAYIKRQVFDIPMLSNTLWTHYRASPKRGDVPKDIIGILVHDHWKTYFTIECVTHGLCDAHHLRELKALTEIEKESWSRQMARLLTKMCV